MLTIPNPVIITFICFIFLCIITLIKLPGNLIFHIFAILTTLAMAHEYIMPQDDLYSNFLTSYNLMENGILSVSRFAPQEGTVEYIYFALVGLLAGTDRSLIIYISVMLSAIFGFLAIVYAAKLAFVWTGNQQLSRILFLFFLSSGYIMYNLFCGYGYTLFVFLLMSGFYLLITEKSNRGPLILASVPLIRPEGIFIFPLIYITAYKIPSKYLKNKFSKAMGISWAVISFLPFILRKIYYGHWSPVPGLSKQAPLFHWPAIYYGAKRLIVVLAPVFALAAVVSIIIFWIYKQKHLKPNFKGRYQFIILLAPILVLTGLYKFNGGDFLFMNRYDMPLFIVLTTLLVTSCHYLLTRIKYTPLILILLTLGINTTFGRGPLFFTFVERHVPLQNIFISTQYFHRVGAEFKEGLAYFFNYLYPTETKKIGVIELNTFGYFSNHQIFDLLGTTNKDIAFSEPDPRMDLFVGFKKRNPQVIEDYDLDMIVGRHANYWNYDPDYINRIRVVDTLDHNYFGWGKGGGEYILGGEAYLQDLGLLPALLIFNNIAFSMRFSTTELITFEDRLKVHIPYQKLEKDYRMEIGDL